MRSLMDRLQACLPVVHTDRRRVIRAAARLGMEVTCISVTTDNIRLGDHYHPYWEIFLVAGGAPKLVLENPRTEKRRQRQLRRGDIVVIHPGLGHVFLADTGCVLVGMKTSEKFDAPKYVITVD